MHKWATSLPNQNKLKKMHRQEFCQLSFLVLQTRKYLYGVKFIQKLDFLRFSRQILAYSSHESEDIQKYK